MITLTPKDFHAMIDGKANHYKLYNAHGALIREGPCFPHGQHGPRQDVWGGDTVAGTYKLGKPQWTQPNEDEEVKREYGWCFIPLVDYQGVAAALSRGAFGYHGGGHWADHWAPKQELTYTNGCCRGENEEVDWMAHKTEEVHAAGGDIYWTVQQ